MDYSGALTFNLLLTTGQCISHFTNRKVPYCVKFNPDEDKQNLLVAGMSDKKIVQVKLTISSTARKVDHVGQAGCTHEFLCLLPVPAGP